MADIRAFFMGGGAKKKDTDGAKAAGGSADAPEAKVPSKSPKKAAPRGAGKAEAKQQAMDDEVIEVKASGSKDAAEQISTGSKRGERGVVDVDTTPSKKSRAAERFPAPSHVHEGEAESGGAVVQSKFFADSPTKAAAAAAKKRKERDVVEIASTDSDEDKGKDKGKKAATVTASHSAPAPDIGDLAAFASNGSANAGQPGEKLKGEKSPEKKKRALPSTLLKSEEAAASKTPQGKLNSPPSSTPPTKKPGEKTSDSKSSQQGAEQSPSAGGVPAEEAPKKKFNPWNQEKVEVPNKHLRDQKIADNRGKENCLAGMTFVITGVLDSMERDECADLIKSYGGKVTSGVSGKTSYLIVGTDAGQSKLDKARQKNCKTIDEDGLFGIIKASGPPTAAAAAPTSVLPAGATTSQTAPVHAGGAFKSSVSGKSAEKAPKSSVPSQTSSPLKKKDGNEHAAPSLWVDKWAPKGTEDLMGNGDKREQLRKWLVKWGSAEANSGAKAGGKAGAGGGKPDTVHKAVLMHGPPGIGKSSSARVMIETCGYTMIELNASDVRNKAGLQEKVASLTQNQSINALMKAQKKALQTFSGPKAGICVLCGKREREHFKGSAQQCYASFVEGPNGTSCHICGKPEDEHYGEHKQCYGTCLVMDEVDGMSSGDRGGVAELIQIIKNTRVPIICIANDGYNQKIKSLKNYCLELKFSKPMHTQVVKRLKMIAESEGFRVHNENALEKLYLGSGNDIRHVINALQTWRMRTSDIRYDDVAAERAGGGKDSSIQQTSAFDVVPRWFLSDSDHKDASFRDRLDMFFYDTDLMPLFVQENYVKVRVSLPRDESYSKDRGDYNIIRRMAEAADCISEADTVNDRIRKSQHWGLLPTYGNLSTISASFPIRGQPPPSFFNGGSGSWPPPLAFPSKGLGHQSTMSKKKRLLLDLSRCIKLNAFANPSEVAMDYVPVLRHRLCAPLLADAADGVPTTLKMMDEYLLSKDELETITSELRLADIKVDGKATEVSADMYAKVDSKVKAALTRGYNKESHTVKFIKPKMGAAMMSKGKTTKAVGRSGEEKESDDDYVDDDEEEAEAADIPKKGPVVPAKKATKGGATKKAAAKKPSQKK